MNKKNPYLPINKEWLDLHKEEALLPDLEIIDPHHHLWDLEFGKYLNDNFIEDAFPISSALDARIEHVRILYRI